jgi:hypothetical protein
MPKLMWRFGGGFLLLVAFLASAAPPRGAPVTSLGPGLPPDTPVFSEFTIGVGAPAVTVEAPLTHVLGRLGRLSESVLLYPAPVEGGSAWDERIAAAVRVWGSVDGPPHLVLVTAVLEDFEGVPCTGRLFELGPSFYTEGVLSMVDGEAELIRLDAAALASGTGQGGRGVKQEAEGGATAEQVTCCAFVSRCETTEPARAARLWLVYARPATQTGSTEAVLLVKLWMRIGPSGAEMTGYEILGGGEEIAAEARSARPSSHGDGSGLVPEGLASSAGR